ncbi:MAG: glycosyltransferase family 2 protein [Bacteroidales bacterium]
MEKRITVFMPAGDHRDLQMNLGQFEEEGTISKVFLSGESENLKIQLTGKANMADIPSLTSTSAVKKMASVAETEYVLICTRPFPLRLGENCLQRMLQVADDTGAGMVYSDYYEIKEGKMIPHPVIDYQQGSLRDDFNFGSLMFFRTSGLRNAAKNMNEEYQFAALYDLRLKVSQKDSIFRIPEFLYAEMEADSRLSGQKMFDYVDPRNRHVQIEMEKACTAHLKETGAWLKPVFRPAGLTGGEFPVEVSVIIPVRNRVKTIQDAVDSVLSQKTSFNFNLIIVDNHSSDGTTELLNKLSGTDKRIIHIIPSRDDLGIGGCWNLGVFHPQCGRFAIQLDSDDIYIDNNVLQKITDEFYRQDCVMIVGSYKMVNFNLEEIPPGLIDHREWTPENGRNNALRINGLGAPRAFYTPVIRETGLPNVSYGEDYALGLAVSRNYQIGRIYEPLYLCRRWDENTDSALDISKLNTHNTYKDRVRTIEFLARISMNNKFDGN